MKSEDNDKLVNDRDLAAMLGVSEGFVRNGGLMLPYVKIGRTKRTRLSDVRKLIEAGTVTKRRVKRPNGVYEEVDLVTGQRTLVEDDADGVAPQSGM